MAQEKDRLERASDYVFGRMDEAERERAERDLERDPKFRDAVIRLAERLRARSRNGAAAAAPAPSWKAIEASLAGLPQMRSVQLGRAPQAPPGKRGWTGIGLQWTGGWRGAVIAAGLIAACAIGFLAGRLESAQAPVAALVPMRDMENRAGAVIEISADGRLSFLPFAVAPPPAGKVLRLWTTGEKSATPLGVMKPDAGTRWRGPELPPSIVGRRYWLTQEDAGATAAVKPTGSPVLEGVAIAMTP